MFKMTYVDNIKQVYVSECVCACVSVGRKRDT